MKQFTLDLRQANRVNPSVLRFRPVVAGPPSHPLPPEVRPVLKAGLELGKGFDPRIGLLNDVAGLGYGASSAKVLRPASAPAFALSSSSELTIAAGLTAYGFAVFGAGFSAGLYASTTREIGRYTTRGFGVFTAVGLSAGGEYSFILGTPRDLDGPYLSAGVSVAPGVVGIGAALLFAPGPPLTLMGVCISVTVNTPSVAPVTITLEVTNTKVVPMVRF